MSARYELRRRLRTALATSSSADEYIARLTDLNVKVAPSFARGSMDTVRGYKVALPGVKDNEGKPIWYAPSKLDATLGWPNIRKRCSDTGVTPAEERLRSLHNSNDMKQEQVAIHKFDPSMSQRLMSGKSGTGPDTLSNIYARLSMQIEQNSPGTLWKLSEEFARASQGQGNAKYAMRMNARFSAKRGRGWLAIMQQANRLSRAMTTGSMATARPQLTHNVTSLLAAASRTVQASTEQTPQRRGQTITQQRPSRNDIGYDR